MTASRATSWRWPELRLGPALVLFLAFGAMGLWRGGTVAMEMLAGGSTEPWSRPLLWELTGTLAAWAVLWIPMAAALNAPRPGGRWARFLGLHLGGWAAYWALKSVFMLTPRFLLYPALGWGAYDYPRWPLHLAMEAMKDAITYALVVLLYLLFRAWRERQAEQLRQVQLEAELRDAQLRQLTGQLDPHFLFNALNTVSSVMYEDLDRTDALLTDLGQLLRAGLERRGPTWALAEEEAHLRRYGALLLARFQDRLRLEIDLAQAPPQAQVPRFALQRLVENAVKHNQDRQEPLTVRVVARAEGGRLELRVADDGEGFKDPARALAGEGHGLRGLREALRLLYGEAAELSLDRGPGGGAAVVLRFPCSVAP
ncbi:MAG: histidine kinase [Geothrix sp.]|nr:histidine kinase [Geothrix sp.]